MSQYSQNLRRDAARIINEANEIEGREAGAKSRFIVVEVIQDGRARASGPFTWDEAEKIASASPNRTICDYGLVLP